MNVIYARRNSHKFTLIYFIFFQACGGIQPEIFSVNVFFNACERFKTSILAKIVYYKHKYN